MEAPCFSCSICGDGSRDICVFCTKDACSNHICERCRRCSDCCECDMPKSAPPLVVESYATPACPEDPPPNVVYEEATLSA